MRLCAAGRRGRLRRHQARDLVPPSPRRRAADLRLAADRPSLWLYAPAIADWAGYWGDKDRYVSIKVDGGDLAIEAKMTYQGAGPVFGRLHGKGRSGRRQSLRWPTTPKAGRSIRPRRPRPAGRNSSRPAARCSFTTRAASARGAANFDGLYAAEELKAGADASMLRHDRRELRPHLRPLQSLAETRASTARRTR